MAQPDQQNVSQGVPHDDHQESVQGGPQGGSQGGLPGVQAIVFGASGITGYPLLGNLIKYPSPTTFGRIIGLTNRPLSRDISQLPNDGRIELYSGMDLLNREASLQQLAAIPGIGDTTHVYFASYTGHGDSYAELRRKNEELLTNAVGAVEICCPNLQFFTLQTGGKAYGVEFKDQVSYNPPLREDTPRIPEPYASNIFYYGQHDIMMRASAAKPWTFCEIRPDAIIGFVPQNNAMNLGQGLALFLSLWKDLERDGDAPRSVPFPGSEAAFTAPHTDTSQDVLARFHIFASLHPERVAEKAFNVADGPACTWEQVWPRVCEYFGLRGLPPSAGQGEAFSAQQWMEQHQGDWAEWVRNYNLREGAIEATGFDFMQQIMDIPFQRDYDLTRSREVGFLEERLPWEGYWRCFDEMRRAGIIP